MDLTDEMFNRAYEARIVALDWLRQSNLTPTDLLDITMLRDPNDRRDTEKARNRVVDFIAEPIDKNINNKSVFPILEVLTLPKLLGLYKHDLWKGQGYHKTARTIMKVSPWYDFDRRIELALLNEQSAHSGFQDTFDQVFLHFCLQLSTIALCEFIDAFLFFDSNQDRIRSIVSTQRKIDGLGRPNDGFAIKSICRLVRNGHPNLDGIPVLDEFAKEMIRFVDNIRPNVAVRESGIDFERRCAQRFEDLGFAIEMTSTTGDFGGDLVARKEEYSVCIQCKNTRSPVGVKAVQEALAAQKYYVCDYAVVVAVSGFTAAAIEMAATSRVVLCEFDALDRLEQMLFSG